MPGRDLRFAPPLGTEPLGMKAQLRGHFRGRPAAIEPQLHSVLLERSIKLLTDLLRFDHRLIHSLIVFHGLSLPVSAKSLQPHGVIKKRLIKRSEEGGKKPSRECQ